MTKSIMVLIAKVTKNDNKMLKCSKSCFQRATFWFPKYVPKLHYYCCKTIFQLNLGRSYIKITQGVWKRFKKSRTKTYLFLLSCTIKVFFVNDKKWACSQSFLFLFWRMKIAWPIRTRMNVNSFQDRENVTPCLAMAKNWPSILPS